MKLTKYVAMVGGAALAVALTGCGSIVHGTTQKETFLSQPSSANVTIDGLSYGKTPATVKLERSNAHTVTISLPGYRPATIHFERKMSGWYFGNIVFGGVIGLIVDAADGAIYKLSPNAINGQVQKGKKNTLTVILSRHVPKGAQKVGQLVS